MPGVFENQKTGVRILFGVIIGMLAISMLLYLVPQGPGTAESATDAVATVGDQSVTLADITQQLNEIRQRNQIPPQLESLYASQILKQLIFQKEVDYEAKRLGITVSDKERADRIKQYLPTAFNGDTFVGMDAYAREVQTRFQMTVPVFEELVRSGLVEEKFRRLVTDGVSVSPAEIEQEFRYQNEKIKLDYVLAKPDDLAAKINPDDAEIKSYFEQNKSKFQITDKRIVRYGLLDLGQLRQNTAVTDDELKAAYNANIQQFQVQNRVHAEHILFLTTGKTDAEVVEIKKHAEDVLAQAKKGANFEDLATKYSEDPGSKTKKGDLGWLVQGQTVPEFEKAAFSLDKGQISDLIRTQYGFHIIKVIDKETAHTKPFDEVKDQLRTPLLLQKVDQEAASIADKMSSEIRQSNKVTLDELATKYHLTVADTHPVAANEPVLELGNSQAVKDEIFRLRQGELSVPLRTDRGYVVLSLKQVIPAHPATLEEVRDKIIADIKQQKADQLAHSKVDDLAKRVKAGEKFDSAAKALGLDPKLSELFSRSGNVSGLGSGKLLASAFDLKQGDLGVPRQIGVNWLVYQVAEKVEPNPADLEAQKKSITDSLLQTKRSLAFDAFRTSLEDRLKAEGKVKIMPDKLKGFGNFGRSGFPTS
ncbi:MAG TPA: peptidyl-prolyl cis-trans isomerase [Candidatus Saccharimonadales bacterium]|nr:peptidyl-prolyl cis-trans isomerase [Candidatus Saccharimonadales bacterium]